MLLVTRSKPGVRGLRWSLKAKAYPLSGGFDEAELVALASEVGRLSMFAAVREGWLWTGDMGSMDEDGFLTLRDRSKDVIISGGSNIYPREVEEVLLRHPGVREVSVVGQSDSEWCEVVVAFLVADVGTTAEALDALCLGQIARFKRPKAYRFVESLPKNNYGKALKTELRRQLQA